MEVVFIHEFKEFTKTSIHNHFGDKESEKKLDEKNDKKIVLNHKKALDKLNNAKVNKFQLLSYTNSNCFILKDYITLYYYAKKLGIVLIPGIEINIKNNENKYLHVVLIVDPKINLHEFETKVNEIYCENKKNYMTIEQLVALIFGKKTIVIPHGIKQNKDGKSGSTNPKQLSEIIAFDEAIPVIVEDNKAYHRETLVAQLREIFTEKDIAWLEKSENISSADRIDYDKISSPTYIWGNSTFDDLYYSILIKNSRIKREEDIIKKTSYISKIKIHAKNENNQIENVEIFLSHGLNSIIGKSGSGKTLLLNAIYKNLRNQNLTNSSSSVSNYDEIYKDINISLYNSNDEIIKCEDGWKVYEGANLYNKILKAYSNDQKEILNDLKLSIDSRKFVNKLNLFSNNLNMYKNNLIKISKTKKQINDNISTLLSNIEFTKNNNKTSNSISYLKDEKLLTERVENLSKITKNITDLRMMNKFKNKLIEIDNYYNVNKNDEFVKLINVYENAILKERNKNLIKELIIKKKLYIKNNIFDIVKNYNGLVGKKNEAILLSEQEIMNNIEYIKKHLIDLKKLKTSNKIPLLNKNDFQNTLIIPENDYSKINILPKSLNIPNKELCIYFDANIGSQKGKVNVSEFRKIENLDLTNEESVEKFINVFLLQDYEFEIKLNSNYDLYLDHELQLKDSNNTYKNINLMSAGELGKSYIQNMIDLQIKELGTNMIIVFDQPENNLEKAFILNDLAKKIDSLRNKYQVIITTHEPLLVVNADSNNIIYAKNEKSAISVKNKIIYEKLSFINAKNKKEMINTIANLVDGSISAVKERNKIYGGMLNENKS